MAQRVLFLGGGVAGVMTANRLARQMRREMERGEVEIVVLSESETHFYQPSLLYVAFGETVPESYQRPLRQVVVPGIHVVVDAAVRVLPDERVVECRSGNRWAYDFLVIATGSHPDLDAIPGLRQGSHTFYLPAEARRLRQALDAFEGGRVVLNVNVPHKCPVAPLEFVFMLDARLRRSGRREATEIVYTYPIGRLHALAPVAEWAAGAFAERGIVGETLFNAEEVDPEGRKIRSLEGEEIDYDLLVVVPPHRGARVLRDSGLGDKDGWLPTDRQTLKMKGQERIYVLGDATDLPISKAGSTAHYESEVVARNLAHELRGEAPSSLYDGKVFCFVETGGDEATYVSFDYANPPRPVDPVTTIHWFKLAFNEMYWLSLRGWV
ncbi:MAG: NAD(P)/FAD-dependent oxidoreductase [Firmicutes bacterium]|nr:NAD(P)/FAD-dependent oxidoreductase [Bacillota bacterium]